MFEKCIARSYCKQYLFKTERIFPVRYFINSVFYHNARWCAPRRSHFLIVSLYLTTFWNTNFHSPVCNNSLFSYSTHNVFSSTQKKKKKIPHDKKERKPTKTPFNLPFAIAVLSPPKPTVLLYTTVKITPKTIYSPKLSSHDFSINSTFHLREQTKNTHTHTTQNYIDKPVHTKRDLAGKDRWRK